MHSQAQFGNIFDLDNYTDAVSNAADWVGGAISTIGDAGKLIGGLLKTIAPVVAMYPGLGTAFSVAVYAAGAACAKDDLSDAVIGTASSALPPGLPRIAFDGAANITVAIADGSNVLDTAMEACRQAAGTAGPQASAAFDSGVAVMRGGKIDQRAIDAGRAFALTSGGQAAATAYDAGISIARGNTPDQVILDTARGYIRDMGGPMAAAAFDTGVAMGYGKTLQEAGWIGLHTYVKGNDAEEQILNFIDAVGRAKNAGMAVEALLQNDLVSDFMNGLGDQGIKAVDAVQQALQPITDFIGNDLNLLNFSPGDLAKQWNIPEEFVRTAQAIMRSGVLDNDLLQRIYSEANKEKVSAQLSALTTTTVDPNRAVQTATFTDPTIAALKALASGTITSTKDNSMSVATLGKINPAVVQKNKDYADKGAAMATTDARIAAGRATNNSPDFKRGYDVGIGCCTGTMIDGPGQQGVKNSLTTLAGDIGGDTNNLFMGFDVGQAVAHGITKQTVADQAIASVSGNPMVAVGQIATNGMVGNGTSGATKAGVAATLITNPAIKAGVQSTVDANKGFFTKVLEFFGL